MIQSQNGKLKFVVKEHFGAQQMLEVVNVVKVVDDEEWRNVDDEFDHSGVNVINLFSAVIYKFLY